MISAHAVERVAAGVEMARSLPVPFTFVARAENLIRGRPDLDDTIKRLQAFEKAGADVLYAPGLRDLETMRTVRAGGRQTFERGDECRRSHSYRRRDGGGRCQAPKRWRCVVAAGASCVYEGRSRDEGARRLYLGSLMPCRPLI